MSAKNNKLSAKTANIPVPEKLEQGIVDTVANAISKTLFKSDLTATKKNTGILNEIELNDSAALINYTDDLLWSVSSDFKLIAANKAFIKGLENFTGLVFKPGDNLLRKDLFTEDFLGFWEYCYKKALVGRSFNKEIYTAANNNWKESWTDTSFNPIYKGDKVVGVACYSRNITEKKIAEEKLRQSEARLIMAQDVAKLGSWETDLKSLNVIWSEETYRIFELDPGMFSEIRHPGFLAFVHPEDQAAVEAAFASSLSGHSVNTIEHRIITENGHIKILEERWRIFRDGYGKPARAVGTCQDITERKKTDKALQAAYNEKNIILESITDAFFAVDKNWVVTYWNKEAEKILHTPKGEIVGHHLWEVFSNSIDSLSYKKYHQAVETHEVIHFQDHYPSLDKWYEITAYPSIAGLSVYFKDVSERKGSEAAAQKAYEEKNTVLERIDDGFFAVDKNSIVTYWNKRAEMLLDTKKEDLIGKNLHEVFIARGSRIFYDNYVKALSEKITIHFEGFSNLSKKWLAVSAYGSDNGLSVYFKDVTKQKNAEEKIKESEIRYRSLIEQATDSICILDASGKFIEMNPSGCIMFGYPREEILQLFMTDVLFEEDLKIDPIRIDELKAGTTTSNERRIKRKDGATVEVELSAKMIEDGKIIVFGRDITGRKKAENKLKESELRYRSIIEQATDAICIADASRKIIDINPYGCQMLGYSREEFLLLTVADLFLPEDLKANPFKIEELKLGKIIRNERRFVKKDGTIIEVEMSGRILEDGRFIVFGHDIAERKKAEDKLKESELRYRSLNEQATDAICVIDSSLKFIDINRYGCEIFGYTEEEGSQLFLPDILFAEDMADNPLNLPELMLGKTTWNERRLKRKDGTAITMEVSTKLTEDGGMIMFGHDIAERKKAEDKLKESELRYRSLNEQATDAICITDASMKFIHINPYACETFGYTEEEALQLSLPDILFAEDLADNPIKLKELKLGKTVRNERRLKRKDGTAINMEVSTKLMEGGRMIMFGHDITKRKKAEEKIQKANRLYTFISQVNQNIVHIKDEGSLFRNACQIATEFGRFKMAWVGMFENATKKITLIEQIGIPDAEISNFIHAPFQANGPQGHVLQTKSHYICNNIQDDPELHNWKSFAAKYELSSMIVLPITKAGKVIGTFNLYTDELNFFDKEEIAMLTDVTEDISFALGIFAKEKKQKETEELIVKNEIRFRALIEKSADIKTLSTLKGEMIYSSPALTKVLGYTPEEFYHKSAFDLIHPDDIPAFKEKRMTIMQTPGSSFHNQHRFLHKNGNWVWCEGTVTNMLHEPGVNAMVSNFQDISEKRKTEQQREFDRINLDALINNTTDLMWSVDTACRLINFNQPFFDTIKFVSGKELAKGDDVFSVVLSPEQLGRFKQSYARALSGEAFTEIEYIPTPVEFWSEISYYPIRKGTEVIGTACHSRDITERKQAELLIKESESKYRTLFEQNMAGVYQSTINGVILNCNTAFAKMLKYDSPAELLKLNASALYFSPEERNDFTDKVINQEYIYNYESVLKCKDGSPLYFIENISRRKNEVTGEIFFDGIMIDITEKKQAELLLRQSNERYNLISKATNDMVWDWDLVTGIVYRNKEGWKKIFRTRDTAIENELIDDWDNRVHPEDKRKVKLIQGEIQRSEKDFYEVECRMLRDDGTYAYIHDRGNIIRNERGEAIRLIGATQDITERKEAELQVAKSELRFRSLVQNSSDLISILDEKGYYLYSSPAVKKILGYEPDFIVGKNAFSFIHPDDIATIKADLAKEQTGKNFDVTPFRFKNDKGEWRWLESKITDMRDNPEVQGFVFNSRDVTERKIAEKNLIKTSEELQHALTEQVSSRKKTEESETRLKEAQAIAHLGHWHLNFATQTALWSDEACRIYGLSPEENKQSYAAWVSFIHPEDVDHVMKITTESRKTFSDSILSHRIVLKDGTVKYITAKSKFEFDENGKPVGLSGISHDVTESKIAEDEIKKLSIIARETVNAVVITNPLGEIVWVNEAFTTITEFKLEEVIGKKPGAFLQGDETNLAVIRFMRNKVKNVEPFECDIINYSKSGRKYWLRIQSQPQYDEAGKLKYFFAFQTDITKEKEAEEILKASEERYRYLFNNNPASIFIWDISNFKILEVNDTAIRSYGYQRKEFLTKTALQLSLPADHNKIKHFASIVRQKSEFRSEINCTHLNRSGEEMHMNISSHLIQFKGRAVILALATNITDKILLETELENERRAKQEEITDAVISAQEKERQQLGSELHDNINQILAGARLYLGLAQKELKTEYPYLKETDNLIHSAINEIRDLSHSLIPPSLNESELIEALNNIVETTQITSGITITLETVGFDETHIPDKLKLAIYRIVQEQFSNILKHAHAHKVIVRLIQDNEKTVLSIKDDGVGFIVGKKVNGVGLMNIKTRASLFNGELTIISSPGNGCELRVLFN